VSESFLILHGIGNRRPPQHWQFLLAAALVEAGHNVRYPELPNPDGPNLDDWLAVLGTELDSLTGSRRTVVCHSLACLLWFHAASRTLQDPVDRVLLVSPPASERVPDEGATFRLARLDAPAVRSSARGELAIVCSDADPYNPVGAPSLYGEPLGITATVIEGAAHITPDSGYGSWPFVLEWCLSGSKANDAQSPAA
jgi:predicted alpha/beta hydrolase family esterase